MNRLVPDKGQLYTFGDGRHGKLALGEENFANQFTPSLVPRFSNFTVQKASLTVRVFGVYIVLGFLTR